MSRDVSSEKFITAGGSSGIGLGVARAALQSGAEVLLVGRSVEKLQQAAAALGGGPRLRTYEPHYVTGLLQTYAYARAVLRGGFPSESEEDLERRVQLRLRRQELLDSEDAPTLWVVMEETVLHRVVGGAEVMRAQIDRLLEASELEHVSIDIVPFSAGAHVGACAPFTYFRFDEPELPDVVYGEVLTASMYLDQRSDVAAHLEAHNRMSLLTTSEDSRALLQRMRKEYS